MKKWKSHRFKFCYCYERDGVVYTSIHSERKSTGLKWIPENKDLALKILHQRYITQVTGQGYTLQDGIDKFFEVKKEDFKDTDREYYYRLALKKFFKKNYLLSNRKGIRQSLRDGMNKMDSKVSTKNYYLSLVKSIFNLLKQYDMIEYNPVQDSMFLKERGRKKRPFTDKEVKLILDNTEGELHRFCVIASTTGMRISEILNIKKQDIQDNHLVIFSTKTNKERYFPLDPFPELKEYLYPFETTQSVMMFILKNKLEELGIYEYGMGSHAFRRYAVNNLIKRIGNDKSNLYYLAEIFGHSIEVMKNKYLKDMDIEMINKWLKS